MIIYYLIFIIFFFVNIFLSNIISHIKKTETNICDENQEILSKYVKENLNDPYQIQTNIYENQENLSKHVKENLNDPYYHKIKIKLNKILKSNNNNNNNISQNIEKIITHIKPPQQLLTNPYIQSEFLHSPNKNHELFNSIKTNLEIIEKIKDDIKNNSDNNSNNKNKNNNDSIIKDLSALFNQYKTSHESFIEDITNIANESIKLTGKPASHRILKSPPLFISEDLEYYQVKSLDRAYKIVSYDPVELKYKKENKSGTSYVSLLDQVCYKIDNGSHLLKPAKEYAIYQFNKLLFPTLLLVSPTQLFVLDNLETFSNDSLPPDIRKQLGEEKTNYDEYSIPKLLEKAPHTYKIIENGLQNETIFIQASLIVKGETLENYLNRADTNYNQINLKSYSSHIISSLLSIQTDYKPDNLILEENTNNIIGIDNDESLESNEIEILPNSNNKDAYTKVGNILFTLKELMIQRIDEDVKNQFIQHTPSLFILKWLKLIENKQSNYDEIISKLLDPYETHSQHQLQNNFRNELNLPLMFNRGWITLMFQRFKTIRQHLISNPNTTHQKLFDLIHPLLSIYYTLLSNIYSNPLDIIGSIKDENENEISKIPFKKLLELNKYSSYISEEKIQESIHNLATINQERISITDAIKELVSQTDYNDLIECKSSYGVNECGPFCNTGCKTKNIIVEWLEIVYSTYNGKDDKVPFHDSWYQNKDHLFKRLLKYGTSINCIELVVKSLDIKINNENYFATIVESEILKNPNSWHLVEFLINYFNLDIERIENGCTLLDLSSSSYNFNVFINLIKMGAGKNSNGIDISVFYQTFTHQQKLELKPFLTNLFLINPKITWYISLNQLFPLENTITNNNNKSPNYLETDGTLRRVISEEYCDKLFDQDGTPKKTNDKGERAVTLIEDEYGNGIYLKFKPQFPGIEYAVQILSEQLFGENLTTFCELGSINSIPVLLSQKVPGVVLVDILNQNPNITNEIESSNISKQIILSIIINNADGNLGNYIIVPNENNSHNRTIYKMFSIDNDQSFMPSKATGLLIFSRFSKSLQSDTVLFLFDQMNHVVHQDIIDCFKDLDIYNVLKTWLENLITYHNKMLKLFSSKKKELKQNKETIIGVSFNNGMIIHLYSKLKRLQQLLKDNSKEPTTHLDLLSTLEPLVANRYKSYLNLNISIKERYNKYFNYKNPTIQQLTCTTHSSAQILQSKGIPNSNDIILKLWEEEYSPLKTLGELNNQNKKLKHLSDLILKLYQKESYIISNYDIECLLEADFSTITQHQFIILSEYLKLKEISVLIFRNSQIKFNLLHSNLFKQIVPNLLNKFNPLNQFNLDSIIILDLSGCAGLFNLGIQAYFSTIEFNLLNKLKLDRCPQLSSVYISAPNLVFLSATECKKLDNINIKTPSIKYLNVKGSKLTNFDIFDLSQLDKSYNAFNNLEYLNISETEFSTIKIKSTKLKCLDMSLMKKLTTAYLEVQSIESINFKGCKSLDLISTMQNNYDINFNLDRLLNHPETIEKIKDEYFLIPTDSYPNYYLILSNDSLTKEHLLERYNIQFSGNSLWPSKIILFNTMQLDLFYSNNQFFRNYFPKALYLSQGFNDLLLPNKDTSMDILIIGNIGKPLKEESIPKKLSFLRFNNYNHPLNPSIIHKNINTVQMYTYDSNSPKDQTTINYNNFRNTLYIKHLLIFKSKYWYCFNGGPKLIGKHGKIELDFPKTPSLTIFNKSPIKKKDFKEMLKIRSLKKNVKILEYWDKINTTYETIPSDIEYLYLGEIEGSLLIIPNTVTSIQLCYEFNLKLSPGVIPDSVTSIYIGDIKKPLHHGSIPNSITHFSVFRGYKHSLKNIIPDSVTYLYLEEFKHLDQIVYSLPKNLKNIKLGFTLSKDPKISKYGFILEQYIPFLNLKIKRLYN
ncbi:hypothetical protein DICPUDRAFT_75070 [Dictyostelium purpureum]|uniref:Uncharacterized protein n=1 Tax=Dictyostelium purpureum TaxID=5786 RepID=F0Z9J8_DICPU|nr:uncharacterized protein DICPUDRAFT_75070 [Dictyostelium purpureum]EGC39421.1 hypothetical protein DICPUDRAFT_75070 [Dictyostelium purpureum]|eukprot:XP_003284095.1 hypothetical protein DICPUDRAFT_75070 [Dictyostelium purpureum]